MFILQAGGLPSIALVRIIDGRAETASVGTSSRERESRAIGFLRLLKKFEHTVRHVNTPVPSADQSLCSSQICTSQSTQSGRESSRALGTPPNVILHSSNGAYPGGEEELRKHHRSAEFIPLGEHWAYKYLIDIDGMGYSGRFMALLASESAVIKSTMWGEYITDWLQPWCVYFIFEDRT
jgi:hypothetical protein